MERFYTIRLGILLVGMVFWMRLFYLQVLDDDYKKAADKNIVRPEEIPAYRGEIHDRNGHVLVYNEPVYDLMIIPKAVRYTNVKNFCLDFKIKPVTYQEKLKRAKLYSQIKPSIFIEEIRQEDFICIQEKLADYPGFFIRARTVRKYPFKILANTLGYLGEISAEKLREDKNSYYKQGNRIGITGLEYVYEKFLRGTRGVSYKIVNAAGREQGRFKNGQLDQPAKPGSKLTLTIDLQLQRYGRKLMEKKSGCIVAIEPSTGEILALVSTPTYDPNLFSGNKLKENFNLIRQQPNNPLFHRPIMAAYPPGSIFKVIQAMLALNENVVTPHFIYGCDQSIIKCHDHPSPLNLIGAISHSCNPYFYQLFKRLMNVRNENNPYKDARTSLNKWVERLKFFGLGSPLGIDLASEKGGNVPTVSYYDKVYGKHKWKSSNIRPLGIGQGELLMTSLQVANLAAIIANEGVYYTPHLVKKISSNETVGQAKSAIQVPIHSRCFNIAKRGMLLRKNSRAYRSHTAICGKTGTAQNDHGKDHSVFMGFAPANHPRIAIAVYVENAGWGAGAGAAIGGLMLEYYLKNGLTNQYMEKYVLKGVF